jgi:two-component system, cell cycle response regulator
MTFEKYKILLIQKIKTQLTQWFDSNNKLSITNEEVYRFLHSIKGTAGTIQLGGILQIATDLLEQLEQQSTKHWEKDELRDFLYHLLSVCYEYEHFEEIQLKPLNPSGEEKTPLIQIIDADVSMLIVLKDALEEMGWMVIVSTETNKAIEQYLELHPDCIIIEAALQKQHSLKLLDEIRKMKFVPMISISMVNDRETRMKAYKDGADDFIQKPADIEEFIVRVNRQLERKQMFDQAGLLDELTQVYNRRFFSEMFSRSISELQRSKTPFSIALLDLDLFKVINDSYGHLVGDRVLKKFAQFLKDNIRSSDFVFRYGGEEFAVLFANCNDQEAIEILTRLLNLFQQQVFTHGQSSFQVTFSGGVFFVNDPQVTMSIALKSADEALYKAKGEGRSRIISSNVMVPGLVKHFVNVSVVDDDAIVRTMLVKVIQSMKFDHFKINIQAFEDGKKFFDSNRLDEKGEHFLILDGVMPVMDGLEILQKVKQRKNKEKIHVLMLTARKSESDIARALKLGADDYVTKPFSILELQARIQRLIQRMS